MELTHRVTLVVHAPADVVYGLVSDVTRTGEWSPTCRGCTWEDPARRGPGARFVGRNETPAQVAQRTEAARADMPRTLAAVLDLAEREQPPARPARPGP